MTATGSTGGSAGTWRRLGQSAAATIVLAIGCWVAPTAGSAQDPTDLKPIDAVPEDRQGRYEGMIYWSGHAFLGEYGGKEYKNVFVVDVGPNWAKGNIEWDGDVPNGEGLGVRNCPKGQVTIDMKDAKPLLKWDTIVVMDELNAASGFSEGGPCGKTNRVQATYEVDLRIDEELKMDGHLIPSGNMLESSAGGALEAKRTSGPSGAAGAAGGGDGAKPAAAGSSTTPASTSSSGGGIPVVPIGVGAVALVGTILGIKVLTRPKVASAGAAYRVMPQGAAPAHGAQPAGGHQPVPQGSAPTVPGAWMASHTVPSSGMLAYPNADPSTLPVRLDPNLPVQVTEWRGDWAHITCENQWQAWVDGRQLLGP